LFGDERCLRRTWRRQNFDTHPFDLIHQACDLVAGQTPSPHVTEQRIPEFGRPMAGSGKGILGQFGQRPNVRKLRVLVEQQRDR